MNFVKKNIVLFLLLPIAATFLSYGIFFSAARDQATFYLKDISGNRAALKDLTISGSLQDRYHSRNFIIKEGEVSHTFIYYQDQRDIIPMEPVLYSAIKEGELTYAYRYEFGVSDDANTTVTTRPGDKEAGMEDWEIQTIYADKIDIHAKLQIYPVHYQKWIENNLALFSTGVTLQSNQKEFLFERQQHVNSSREPFREPFYEEPWYPKTISYPSSTSDFHRAMAMMDGKLYFTVPTTKAYTGYNGIFEVEEFSYWWYTQSPEKGTVNTITRFSLEDQNMEVLGLEAVNGRLILIMTIEDVLTFRMFDRSGDFIDELRFPGLESAYILHEYKSYSAKDVLNLCFGKYLDGYRKEEAILSLKVEEGSLKLIHYLNGLDLNDETAQYYTVVSKGEKLVVVASVKKQNEQQLYSFEPLRPSCFMIYVYETKQGQTYLSYQGELITDADEDYGTDRVKDRSMASFSYNPLNYRQFMQITVD